MNKTPLNLPHGTSYPTGINMQDLLDSVPVSMFLINNKRRIIGANRHALDLIEISADKICGLSIGQAFGCIAVMDQVNAECGSTKRCTSCMMTRVVKDSLEYGRPLLKLPAKMKLFISQGRSREMNFLVSSSLIPFGDETAVLIGLEDVSSLLKAQDELERARNREIDTASKIQFSLLSGEIPEHFGQLMIKALTIPSMYVDGDFYDFFKYRDTLFDIMIGDVTGKGVPAALIGAAVKSNYQKIMAALLYQTPLRKIPGLEVIATELHHAIVPRLLEVDRAVTMVYARFDTENRTAEFIDCGHPKTLHYSAESGEINTIEGMNMPYGFFPEATYKTVDVKFSSGDMFFFYSDGVYEARNREGECYGYENMIEMVKKIADKPPGDIVDFVQRDVQEYVGSENYGDDFTLIVIKCT